jgi:two-component sensor histidine kinase
LIILTQAELVNSRKIEVRESALLSAKYADSEMERIVSGVEAVLIAVSQGPDMRESALEQCRDYLARVIAQTPNIASLTFVQVDGAVRCTTLNSTQSVNISDKPYFREALASRHGIVGDYTIGRISGKPVLPIAFAARDQTGRAIAVTVAAIDLVWLSKALEERGLPPGGSVTVADRNGVVLARQPYPERFVGTQIPREFMRLVNAPESGVETIMSRDGTRRVLGYVPTTEPPIGIYVSAGLSAAASFEYFDRTARTDSIFVALATFATLMTAWFFGQRAFIEPLRGIGGVIARWRDGDRAVRTGLRAADGEIDALGAAIDELLGEVDRGEQQRELVARELTHRVKNMFATVMAIANATFRKDAAAKESLQTFLARMTALARTHDVLMGDQVEVADLERLIRRVVAPLCGDVDERFHFSGPAVELPPRAALAMTMVMHELCTNALKHGALKGSGNISIDWRVRASEAASKLDLAWFEPGVGSIPPTALKSGGFGARLIAVAFGDLGSSKLMFERDALVCVISIDLPPGAAES